MSLASIIFAQLKDGFNKMRDGSQQFIAKGQRMPPLCITSHSLKMSHIIMSTIPHKHVSLQVAALTDTSALQKDH